MSIIKKYPIPCPKCKKMTEQDIYHSINTSFTPEGVESVLNDEINFVKCCFCNNSFQVKTSLYFIDYANKFCFHYYPNPNDDEKRKEILINIKRMFGNDFFLANPIVFNDWGEFKNEIANLRKLNDTLKGKPNQTVIQMYERHLRNRSRKFHTQRDWSCNICDGDETTGCLFYDPTECPKFS